MSRLPIAQEYRDLIRLIPAVQYTQDQTRGPSAGGSGQDNVYQFDGVNVTLPLFGTLSAEPASHDIAQVTVIKGGARAVDFDRSGGFSIDSVSKSGTSRYSGQFSYQFQTENMAADLTSGAQSRFQSDRQLARRQRRRANPHRQAVLLRLVLPADRQPEQPRESLRRPAVVREQPQRGFRQADVHADPLDSDQRQLSGLEARRHERVHLSRPTRRGSTGSGAEARLEDLHDRRVVGHQQPQLRTAKYTDFTNKNQGRPDNIANVTINTAPGTQLDIDNLDTSGLLTVPQPSPARPTFNDFVTPLINRYGYPVNGVQTGGGTGRLLVALRQRRLLPEGRVSSATT